MQGDIYTDGERHVYIYVTQIPEFAALVERARKEAEQLNHTIRELSHFTLDVQFFAGEPPAGGMEDADSATSDMETK